MLQLEILIRKLCAINTLATSAVVIGEVASLQHEAGNHSVKCASFVAETLLSGAQRTEVFRRFWYNIRSYLRKIRKA